MAKNILITTPEKERQGYIRAEEVINVLKPEWGGDTYVVSGPRFRKDGKLGKKITSAYLRVLTEEMA